MIEWEDPGTDYIKCLVCLGEKLRSYDSSNSFGEKFAFLSNATRSYLNAISTKNFFDSFAAERAVSNEEMEGQEFNLGISFVEESDSEENAQAVALRDHAKQEVLDRAANYNRQMTSYFRIIEKTSLLDDGKKLDIIKYLHRLAECVELEGGRTDIQADLLEYVGGNQGNRER